MIRFTRKICRGVTSPAAFEEWLQYSENGFKVAAGGKGAGRAVAFVVANRLHILTRWFYLSRGLSQKFTGRRPWQASPAGLPGRPTRPAFPAGSPARLPGRLPRQASPAGLPGRHPREASPAGLFGRLPWEALGGAGKPWEAVGGRGRPSERLEALGCPVRPWEALD